MSRVNARHVSSLDKMKYLDLLWTSIAGLQTREEVKNFFKDLLSVSEAVMLGRRIQIAKMLLDGKTYEQIAGSLRAGEDTIGKVQQWLSSGFGGYEKAVRAFEQVAKQRMETEKVRNLEPYSFEWLKRKYPLHFLLFNVFDKVSQQVKNKRKTD